MNWLATFFYILAAVETFMLIVFASRVMSAGVRPLRAILLCLIWPLLPVMFLFRAAFSK